MSKKNNRRKGSAGRKKKVASPVEPDTKTPCKFFLEGKCRFGDECKFSHETPNAVAPAPEVCVEANDSEVEVKGVEKEEEIVVECSSSGTAHEKDAAAATTTTIATDTVATPKQSKGPLRSVFSSMTSIITSPFSASKPSPSLPPGLEISLSLFTPSQQELAKKLCQLPGSTNQTHLFEHWPSSDNTGSDLDEKKKDFMSKLEYIDQSYPDGGLIGYLKNAINLLEKSRKGENPLEGWTPSVPKGEAFTVGTDAFLNTEKLGLKEVGKCGFVLVAGGLGERLGYGDIKVSCSLRGCN